MMIPGIGSGATPVDDGDAYASQKSMIIAGLGWNEIR